MPSLQTTLGFFLVSALLALSPGPDNVFVLVQSALRGPRAGLLVVLGLCSGLVVHTAAVALGLAALFAASAAAFTALKWIGAAYLLYLAWARSARRSTRRRRPVRPRRPTRGGCTGAAW